MQVERQGINKQTGKANTQLELGEAKISVKDVVEKLSAQLELVRKHQAQYEWRNIMRKVDHFMSDPNKHRVICTDFGATLDLMSIEKDNSSVNNHAVICILFVSYNWRTVQFKKLVTCGESTNEIDDQTIINDCDKWIFLVTLYPKVRRTITFFTTHALPISLNIMTQRELKMD